MNKQEIDKVLSFSPGNLVVYNSICNNIKESTDGGIMPFIGEGITEFVFGNSVDFINNILKVMEDELSEEQKKCIREKMYENKGFLEALDEIINILNGEKAERDAKYGEDIINLQLEMFYSDKKIDQYMLEHEAISLIPFLNSGDTITTNFDHVLEYAYKLAGITPSIATPYDSNLLNSKLRNNMGTNKALLFMIHGNIISNASERIITKRAFEENYKSKTDFMENLTKWISKYKLLFIGVDLIKEEYLRKVLEETKSEGSHHYAIVGCKENEKDTLRKKLVELNILPILYNVDKPFSIELILHKILVDTNNERILKNSNRGELYYKYSEHDLIGREEEIKMLREFLTMESKYEYDFSWWLFWGKDVSGKSKLAYDFAQKEVIGWDWYMIHPGQVDEFIEKQLNCKKMDRKLFVIFDDFDCYDGDIEKIFESVKRLKRYCSCIRFLFVVREYEAIMKVAKSSSKVELQFMILKGAYSKPKEISQLELQDIKKICYGYIRYRKNSLGLADLEEKEILSIDQELEEYIFSQMLEDKSLVLLCSLEKAIDLILSKVVGSTEGTTNTDILKKVMRYVLTDGEGNFNNENVDAIEIYKRKEYRMKQAEKLMEKYDKEKEYSNDYQNIEREMDSFMFGGKKEK